MNIHEYQAKELFKKYGIKISAYSVVSSLDEGLKAYDSMGLKECVLKIQVHAGGRGKGGGVKFCKNREEVKTHLEKLIGMKFQNNQTGPEPITVNKVMIAEPVDIAKEYYFGAIIDRQRGESIFIASAEGGMEIEEIAHKSPEKIKKLPISQKGEIQHIEQLDSLFAENLRPQARDMAQKLAKLFVEKDATLLEINPLVISKMGELIALDAKLAIDDNALFRQKELKECYDPSQLPKGEVEANKHDLQYIELTGNIGCMVNGAGLAMATMDIIDYSGGKPANFLDVGGGASKEKVSEAFKIILSDPNVKAILVNIFGGIMRCDVLAEGIVEAAREQKLKVPLIVRLEGTNVDLGKEVLRKSGLAILAADSLDDAATKAVQSIGGK